MAAKTERRPARRASTGAAEQPPRLALFGDARSVRKVANVLKDLKVEIVLGRDPFKEVDTETIGLIVVPSLSDESSVSWTVAAVRESKRVRPGPVFAVLPDKTPDRSVRRVYADGASAVFQWPREALLLPRLLAELLGVSLVRGSASKPQVALTRALKAHLRLAPGRTDGVQVKATFDGGAELSGSVESLWWKRELERLMARVPGVKRVASDDLRVRPSGLSDSQIARAVRSVLRSTTRIDEATISVAVHNGTVALAGTVSNRRELGRILDVLTNVRGVRGMTNSLVVSPAAKQRDRTVAGRLSRLLSARFPGERRVKVTVFAQVAVLSGRVSDLPTRMAIESVVEQDPSIVRILNKLDVVS